MMMKLTSVLELGIAFLTAQFSHSLKKWIAEATDSEERTGSASSAQFGPSVGPQLNHALSSLNLKRKHYRLVTLIFAWCSIGFVVSGSLQVEAETASASSSSSGTNQSIVLPQFKLPFTKEFNDKVYFTGGPHQYDKGGAFTDTFTYGLGTGIDFAAGKSFPVVAIASGQVIAADCTQDVALGCIVAVRHDVGTSVVVYAHLDEVSEAFRNLKRKFEQLDVVWVAQGEHIADSGCTGTGSKDSNGKCVNHLHLELRDGYLYFQNGKLKGGPPIGWETLYLGGQIDGYWIWGYAKGETYGSGAQLYNYDGVAVKGNPSQYQLIHGFRFIDGVDRRTDVTTIVGINYACPIAVYNCEDNSIDRDTQFAKTQTGGLWGSQAGLAAQQNTIGVQSGGLSHGILLSSNESPSTLSDSATFVGDVSYPDGTVVTPNQVLTKIWRLKNTGSAIWGAGYKLVRRSGEEMGAPSEASVPSTAPNATADISVNFTAPTSPGEHVSRWQLRNPQGTYFGPEIWIKVRVPDGAPPPTTDDITFISAVYPSVVTPGQVFRPRITIKLNQGQLQASRGDLLRNTDGNLFGAWPHIAVVGTVNAGQSYTFEFYQNNPITAPSAEGGYDSRWRVWRNGNWAGPEITIHFDVRSGGGTRPNPPSLQSPNDWYLSPLGTIPQLCANSMSGVQYYFEIYNSVSTPNSGWIGSNCWTPPGLGPYTFQWHVKVRNTSTNLESDWSTTWHFSIEQSGPSLSDVRFDPASPSAADTVRIYACAVDQYEVYVNTATDGSSSGQWRMVTNALPRGCDPNNSANWINWSTLPWEDGIHLVRFQVFKNGLNGGLVLNNWTYQLQRRGPDGVGLLGPSDNLWLNSRTVTFRWNPSPRAQYYNFIAGTDGNQQIGQLVNQTLDSNTTSTTVAFAEAYPSLYWFVGAGNEIGFNGYSRWQIGIDEVAPASAVAALPATTTETNVVVQWSGATDDRSGIRWYDVQYRDDARGKWVDWQINTTQIVATFVGQLGHTYCFRSRAYDVAGNWENYPSGNGDTCTRIDPTSAPSTPWWNNAYAFRRAISIVNQYAQTLPSGYAVNVHFDSNTTPTAAELYTASQSTPKGNDFRIVYNNSVELAQYRQNFSPDRIDIWFNLQQDIAPTPGSNTTSYQLYYGNAAAGAPSGNMFSVLPVPACDANTVALWMFAEGSGNAFGDVCGRHPGTIANGTWVPGLFNQSALRFNGSSTIASSPDSPEWNLANFTLEMFANRDFGGNNSAQQLVRRDNITQDNNQFQFGFRDEKLETGAYCFGFAGNTSIAKAQPWPTHLAMTFNGATLATYVNGQLDRSMQYPNPGCSSYNSGAGPLVIGNNRAGADYFIGTIQWLRISNVARTSFPAASYLAIKTLPSVAVGSATTPAPINNADLALLSMTTFPNPGGGTLVQAVVQNQGSGSTSNGFFTDLYLGRIPTGPNDYGSSIQFWINDPIAAGAVITLTTVITDMSAAIAANSLDTVSTAPAGETSGTLYGQVDSSGVIREQNNANNIYSNGTQICVANADAYEGDDTFSAATTISLGQTQTHNFSTVSDADWVKFAAQAGKTYILRTFNLGASGDTYLYLYGTDGTTLLASNDDYAGRLASQVIWTAPASGTYYALVKHWNPNTGGCGTKYDLSFFEGSGLSTVYLPLIRR